MSIIRSAAVAGKFYPQDSQQLEHDVQQMLAAAEVPPCRPKILIAPHAGYVYSGPIAAAAFATLRDSSATIQRVVMLGTCHASSKPLIFTTSADSFATPLGDVPTAKASINLAVDEQLAVIDDGVHEFDHAIEVQLPFLQLVLERFEIAPFLLRTAPAEQAARLVRLFWGGAETVFVISSDLSHYLSYDQARAVDQQTAESIVGLDSQPLALERACGFRAIAGALNVAKEKSLRCVELDLRNSGDTAGPKDRVVGYGAFALCE